MAAATWNSSFAICPGDEFFSFSFTCQGEGCDLLNDFPTTTCTMNGNTLSCSNGVKCNGNPDFVSTAEWIINDDNVSFQEHVTAEDCELSIAAADANSSVMVNKDTCNTNTQSDFPTTSIPAVSATTSPNPATSGYSTISSTNGSTNTQSDLPTTSTASSNPATSGYPTISSVTTSTAEASQSATSNSARQLHVNTISVFLLAFIFFGHVISGTLAIDISSTLAQAGSVSVPHLEKRAPASPIDWTKPLKPDSTILIDVLDQLQKMFIRRTAEHIDKNSPMWIKRESFVEELKVNLFDDSLCKALIGEAQNRAWKRRAFDAVKKRTNEKIIGALTNGAKSARLNTPATFFTKFAVDLLLELGLKQTPVVNKISSFFCPPSCADNSDFRLTDPDNCGKCGIKCKSGKCIHGTCVVDACDMAGSFSYFRKCGVGVNAGSCTCASGDMFSGFCVQYQSSALRPDGEYCESHEECDPGYACAKLPTGKRSVCMDATSCLIDKVPDHPTENVPHFENGNEPEPSPHRAWVFHARTPLSGVDEGGDLVYAQDAVTLHMRSPNYLVVDNVGRLTVNAGCVKVVDTSQPLNTVGVTNTAVVDKLPKGYGFYFGYTPEEDINDVESDSCCLTLYTDDKCSAGSAIKDESGCGIQINDFTADVLSWKVDGCKMLYSEI
ncbi:hypothetical protein GP486_002274 [Trichoglossum hirsutum]|uniref:Uncharacterized protein n=1 Tax=Trichoglossum hirsutum TaxID=265104 RepID=A0A9P8RRV8_9PEZI|nr:hypothetical protein GP486_002274 [Trichoglossum hirsutum]